MALQENNDWQEKHICLLIWAILSSFYLAEVLSFKTINALSLTKFEKIITTNHPHLLSAGDDRKFV